MNPALVATLFQIIQIAGAPVAAWFVHRLIVVAETHFGVNVDASTAAQLTARVQQLETVLLQQAVSTATQAPAPAAPVAK